MSFEWLRIATLLLGSMAIGAVSCAQPLPDIGEDETNGSTSDGRLPGDATGSTGEVDGTTEPPDAASSETGIEPGCGNGIVEAGETCDDGGQSASCDADCTDVVCGDETVNTMAGEECEALDLAGGTCQDLGFDGGTLTCDAGCVHDPSGCGDVPAAPMLELSLSQVKQFDFGWAAVPGSDYYQLLESIAPDNPFIQLGDEIIGESISVSMPLHFRSEASYALRACNAIGCTNTAPVAVMSPLVDAVGYFKASNSDYDDQFGWSVALSGDGSTLAVGARHESSLATGIDGDQFDDSAVHAGAVYVFVRDYLGVWSQQAYIKASTTDAEDAFGHAVTLSNDGNTLAVGANFEDSSATGIDGDQTNDSVTNAGAAYVFVRDGSGYWTQQAYIKASNPGPDDRFGESVALSGDGNTLAVGAYLEDGSATGINGNQENNSFDAGATYVFVRDGVGSWSQQAYIKASNTDDGDHFGGCVTLSGDGNTLAVGAPAENSNATGIDGNQANESAAASGAVYVFVRDGTWLQQAYVKASNTGSGDHFGSSVALSGDGSTLAVGAPSEDGNSSGIGGDQTSNSSNGSGAVYMFASDGAGAWSQQAYVKSSNTDSQDSFGQSVALTADGAILAVGAVAEASNAVGVGGDQSDDSASYAGAAYVFIRDEMNVWSQRAYIKASNTAADERFGGHLALSGDGEALAVGASWEDSSAIGIGGDQSNDLALYAGAVYLY